MIKTNNAIRLIEFKRGTQYGLWLLSITLTFSQQWWNNLLGNTWVRNNFLNWILYLNFKSSYINHRTIIPTGITFKKTSCYMRNSARRWLIVENAKIFRSYVKHFLIFPCERNCKIFIGWCKEDFMNHSIMALDRDNTGNLVPASFSYFLELFWEKNRF